jgi:arylsulfatase A-like enzyme
MSEVQTKRRPNLLLIVVDCLRADRCPTTGVTDLTAWRRLRDDGCAFSQAISSASWTPVCFAGLLSGCYSLTHGVRTIHGPAIDPALPTLATQLRDAGYSTHAFVTGPMLEVLGMNRGFDEYHHRPKDAYVYGEFGRHFAERFDALRSQDQPWFCMLHLFEVHHPRQAGSGAAPHTVREYDDAWRRLDGWIAELLDQAPDGTIVALTADHGESIRRRADVSVLGHLRRKLREHLKRGRRPDDWRRHGYHVFDEIVRIPWVIAGAGVPKTTVDQQVRQVDIAPTIIDILGLQMPGTVDGRSLLPAARGAGVPEQPAYVESGCDDPLRDWHGIREPGWKYAEHPRWGKNLRPEPMLFDLMADADERRNVIDEYPDEALRLRAKLDEIIYRREGGDAGGQAMSEDDQALLTRQLKALGYI